MIDYLYLTLYKFFTFLVRITPDSFLSALSSLLYNISKKYQKVIHTNLSIAFPSISKEEKKRIAKHSYLNFLHTISGFIKREGKSKEQVIENITFKNDQALLRAIEEKKKIIFITAHFGNWELLPIALTTRYQLEMSIVGKSLKSPRMQKILRQSREKFGIELIDKEGAVRGMMKALSKKRTLGLLVDHHTTTNEGAIINFFGKEATQTMSSAMIARKFDAILFPVFISSEDFKHYRVEFYPEITPIKTEDTQEDIKRMTQQQADVIEKAIREKPDEWFWLHRRWKYCCENLYEYP
jgi:KDO2-lipid IV(A) lauroyltransferase